MHADDLGRRLVDAIDASFGTDAGFRAAHAKGVCCEGTFLPTPAAAELTTAPHMQGGAVPVIVRFSNAGSNPDMPDYAVDVLGMAVKFLLPDGRETDIVAISLPVFFVRDAEAFIDLTRSRRLNPKTRRPSPFRILGFLARHPEAAPAIWYSARKLNQVPASRVQVAYHGLHAFRWIDAKANPRYVRYDLVPEAGAVELPRREARGRGRDFLQEDLIARLGSGPARFKLVLQLADVTDPVKDASKAWPASRPLVEAGSIEITRISADQDQGCERRVFDPTRVIDGIECSDDPLLEARRQAYSVSIERRLAARR